MTGRRALLPGLVAASWLGLGPASASASEPLEAIVDGQPTTSDPAVVALVTRDVCRDTVNLYCTGTLVAPRVVLTAAHCVDQPVELVEVFFGDDVEGAGQWRRAAALRAHPDFDRQTFAHDIGVVILEQDAPVAPIELSVDPLTSEALGTAARLVGFGVPEPGGGATGIKRTGQTRVSAVDAQAFEVVPDPAMSCQVDSGGPVLRRGAQGVEGVAGITSHGDATCEVFARNTRVDAYAETFLGPVLDEVAGDPPVAPPPPDPEACPGCSALGCADGERCDASTDRCVPDDDAEARGCGIGSPAPIGLLPGLWSLLLARRRHSRVTRH